MSMNNIELSHIGISTETTHHLFEHTQRTVKTKYWFLPRILAWLCSNYKTQQKWNKSKRLKCTSINGENYRHVPDTNKTIGNLGSERAAASNSTRRHTQTKHVK